MEREKEPHGLFSRDGGLYFDICAGVTQVPTYVTADGAGLHASLARAGLKSQSAPDCFSVYLFVKQRLYKMYSKARLPVMGKSKS